MASSSDSKSTTTVDADEGKEVERLTRPLYEYFKSSSIVKVYVGPALIAFNIHEELLCDKVKFFKSAFQGGFKESREKEMDLPEDDPVAFGHLIEWLYESSIYCGKCRDAEQRLVCGNQNPGQPVPKKSELDPAHELEWCKLWILANKLGLNELMEVSFCIYDGCLGSGRITLSPEAVAYVLENTLPGSPLRLRQATEVVEVAFSKDPISEGVGKILNTDPDFSESVLARINDHLDVEPEDCGLHKCKLHQLASSSLYSIWVNMGYEAGINRRANPLGSWGEPSP